MSVAGSSKAHNAPTDEAFGGDSTKFVKVPWDIMQAYLFRATRAAMQLPESSRLAWLEERDVAERAAWVSMFRDGEETLGQIVQTVMEKRSAHWDTPMLLHKTALPNPPAHQQQPKSPQASKRHRGSPSGSPQKGSGKKAPFPPQPPSNQSKLTPGTLATTLRDGTVLCQEFNKGKCPQKGASCAKGVHKCAKITRSGRPCGMSFHGAYNCRNTS